MRRCLLFLLAIITGPLLQAQDLPNPPANLQTMPKGSYIIAVDNTNQLNGTLFNLKAYGLVAYLLNNGAKLKWIITAGKAKDGVDFTVNTKQVRPTVSSSATSRAFSGGPFVIYSQDTTGVAALIDGFYSSAALTGTAQPNVFVSAQAVTVDVRYDMTGFVPYAAILNDGNNAAIHTAFMTAASVPTSMYYTSTGTAFRTSCATFASEPHNDLNTSTQAKIDAIVQNLRTFAQAGGNFLVQCAAVQYYENSVNGYFQSTSGLTVTNLTINTNDSFPNPDLSYSQFVGAYSMNTGGSVMSWTLNGSPINNEHGHALGKAPNQTSVGASVSKLRSGVGGLVFFLGNHKFSTATSGPGAATQQDFNGVRMYLNAFLTPSQMVCMSTLPVSLENFQGTNANGMVKLQWVMQQNEDCRSFEVEASEDGKYFHPVLFQAPAHQNGKVNYEVTLPNAGAADFYRLKVITDNHNMLYSAVIQLARSTSQPDPGLILEGNPFHDRLSFSFPSPAAGSYTVCLYNAQGVKTSESTIAANHGRTHLSLPFLPSLPAGIMVLEVRSAAQCWRAKVVRY